MKIKTIPREYDAIRFNGITKEVEDFLVGTCTEIRPSDSGFMLSNVLGNQGLNIGDYLYKSDSPLTIVSIVYNDDLLGKYFEVIE